MTEGYTTVSHTLTRAKYQCLLHERGLYNSVSNISWCCRTGSLNMNVWCRAVFPTCTSAVGQCLLLERMQYNSLLLKRMWYNGVSNMNECSTTVSYMNQCCRKVCITGTSAVEVSSSYMIAVQQCLLHKWELYNIVSYRRVNYSSLFLLERVL